MYRMRYSTLGTLSSLKYAVTYLIFLLYEYNYLVNVINPQKMIRYNFHRWDKLLSKLIRFFSGGFYNHTSIEINGIIYEAHIHTGVRKAYLDEWDDTTVKTYFEYDLWPKREKLVEDWLKRQVGKKYDTLGVLSFLWRFIPQRMGAWYCSELAMVSFMKLHKIDKGNYKQKKSPQDFYELLYIIDNSKF